MKTPCAVLFLLLAVLVCGCATGHRGGVRPELAVPLAAAAPVIDGDTSDAVWASAARIDGLRPAIGESSAAIPATSVRVLWDATLLYVAFDCADDEVYSSGTLRHDDNLYTEDVVEVFLDGKGDGRQFVEIQVSPSGENLDLMYVYTADTLPPAPDGVSWLREWEMAGLLTAARRTGTGWSAELAIPVEPLVHRLGLRELSPGIALRAQFVRYDHVPAADGSGRNILQQTWSPVIQGNPHNTPAAMGTLFLR